MTSGRWRLSLENRVREEKACGVYRLLHMATHGGNWTRLLYLVVFVTEHGQNENASVCIWVWTCSATTKTTLRQLNFADTCMLKTSITLSDNLSYAYFLQISGISMDFQMLMFEWLSGITMWHTIRDSRDCWNAGIIKEWDLSLYHDITKI